MLKDILLKTAELINRDDIITELNSETQTNSQSLTNDILRMISYFNYTLETLCDNYFNITNTQTFYSDKNKKISYLNFAFEPTKIERVSKNEKPVFFSEFSKFLTVPQAETSYEVTYKFLPDPINNLNDKVTLPKGVSEKIICYGIASQFLASKSLMEQAEFWNNKFMLEIFKSKTSKNRKVKQNFIL